MFKSQRWTPQASLSSPNLTIMSDNDQSLIDDKKKVMSKMILHTLDIETDTVYPWTGIINDSNHLLPIKSVANIVEQGNLTIPADFGEVLMLGCNLSGIKLNLDGGATEQDTKMGVAFFHDATGGLDLNDIVPFSGTLVANFYIHKKLGSNFTSLSCRTIFPIAPNTSREWRLSVWLWSNSVPIFSAIQRLAILGSPYPPPQFWVMSGGIP